jgi:hypothetical protein
VGTGEVRLGVEVRGVGLGVGFGVGLGFGFGVRHFADSEAGLGI